MLKSSGIQTKKCSKCGVTKSILYFNKKTKSKTGYDSHCKECQNLDNRLRYHRRKRLSLCALCGNETEEGSQFCSLCLQKSRETCKRRIDRYKAGGKCIRCQNKAAEGYLMCNYHLSIYRKRGKAAAKNFSTNVGNYFNNICAICGEQSTDYEIFDCHHLNSEQKTFGVASLRHKDWASVVVPELKKCVYLCRNCHARLHAGRFDSDIQTGKINLIPGRPGDRHG